MYRHTATEHHKNIFVTINKTIFRCSLANGMHLFGHNKLYPTVYLNMVFSSTGQSERVREQQIGREMWITVCDWFAAFSKGIFYHPWVPHCALGHLHPMVPSHLSFAMVPSTPSRPPCLNTEILLWFRFSFETLELNGAIVPYGFRHTAPEEWNGWERYTSLTFSLSFCPYFSTHDLLKAIH